MTGITRCIAGVILATGLVQTIAMAQEEIVLWEGTPPLNKPHQVREYEEPCWGERCVYKVSQPTLSLHVPAENPSASAVIVIPGGGYETEAIYHEGRDVARYLADNGIFAATLKYRLPDSATSTAPEQVPLADLRRALTLLRGRSSELGFSPDRVGVLGFSAGSHLAATASLHRSDSDSENPDFSLLIYGVSRFNQENAAWLQRTLFQQRPMTDEESAYYRLLDHIDGQSPPAFLVHAMDDDVCHYEESTLYAEALARHKVRVEMHLYSTGGHGFGMGRRSDRTDSWPGLAVDWIKRLP